jgi:hypothetical protein
MMTEFAKNRYIIVKKKKNLLGVKSVSKMDVLAEVILRVVILQIAKAFVGIMMIGSVKMKFQTVMTKKILLAAKSAKEMDALVEIPHRLVILQNAKV